MKKGSRMERTEKTCTGCGEVFPIDQFMKYWNNQRNTHVQRGYEGTPWRAEHVTPKN